MAHHRRCNLRGNDFEAGDTLRDHVERRHQRADVRWWMGAERLGEEPQFSRH